MDAAVFLLAEAANISREGKVNLLGAFDSLFIPQFPATIAQTVLWLRTQHNAAEVGQEKTLEIRLVDGDGNPIMSMQHRFQAPPPMNDVWPVGIDHLIPIVGLLLPYPSNYAFHVLINGESKNQTSLRAIKVEEGFLPPPATLLPG